MSLEVRNASQASLDGADNALTQSLVDQGSPAHRSTEGDDEFRKNTGYSWDFAMVFKAVGEEGTVKTEPENFREIVKKMIKAGLQVYTFWGVGKNDIFVKLRAPLERLKTQADFIDFKLELDEGVLEELAREGDAENSIQPIEIANDFPEITSRSPYQNVYGKYEIDLPRQDLYKSQPRYGHPFRTAVRMKLIRSILESTEAKGGCGFDLDGMKNDKSIEHFYPLHNRDVCEMLEEQWMPWYYMPWNQPLTMIRNYFGEKIGLYFAFLGHYTTWCVSAAVIGVVAEIDVLAENTLQAYTVGPFAVFIALWCVLMLEYWKRKENTLALEWGMTGFEEEELNRPEFDVHPEVETRRGYINGEDISYFNKNKRYPLVTISTTIIAFLTCCVIGIISGIFVFKYESAQGVYCDGYDKDADDVTYDCSMVTYGPGIGSFINAVQIQLMGTIITKMSVWLTDRENHQTDTAFEDALIGKLFAFQFVNSYASFYYIAFIAIHTEPATEEGDIMYLLCLNLAIIFGSRLVVGNFTEVLLPYIMYRRKKAKEIADEDNTGLKMSGCEKEALMDEYDMMMGTLGDYSELAIQYGYLTLFVVAFPLAPFMALISNYVEIRADGYKLLRTSQRPTPTGAEDIGTWQGIFTIMSGAAVVTNSALVCFVMTELIDTDATTRVWYFILMQYCIFTIQVILGWIVPDEPLEVTVQLQRGEFLVGKLINKIPDDDDEALLEANRNAVKSADITFEIFNQDG